MCACAVMTGTRMDSLLGFTWVTDSSRRLRNCESAGVLQLRLDGQAQFTATSTTTPDDIQETTVVIIESHDDPVALYPGALPRSNHGLQTRDVDCASSQNTWLSEESA